ncbi:AAA family ATPase [Falsiroseomonas sp.]|uniref:AAA family ATPase n=1 Tax=Falsiroseomonas sp. TaxID=2870721 RepID=UPI00356A2FFE
MRLLRLDLLRYGHLADVALDFPREAALHVVLGANEAGKSTALAAIGDALFGFPHLTPFAFRFDTAQLRLGFTVTAADGTEAAFLRRKGRQNTLLDTAETPLPETSLARLLGGAGRDLFETTYGLNGETLRRGALSLLQSGGEAGESLLAGMGLPNLRKALDHLDEQAKALHGDGRGRRRLASATEAWREAHRAAEEAAIKPREWLDALEDQRRITAELENATREAGALSRERGRLERTRRVLPLLAQLDARRRELAEVADAPSLPPGAAATLRRLTEALRQAQEDMRREAAEAARLEAERDALPQDAPVLAVQDEIDALAEQRSAAANAQRDLPEVQRKVAECRATVEEAALQLGLSEPAEAIREAVPKPAERQKAQALIRRRTELLTRLATEAQALREAERRLEQAKARLAEAAPPPAAAPLRRAVEAARGEGPLDRELAAAERALAEAEQRAAAALAALPLWSGDAAALAACPVPLQPATEAAAQRLAQARAEAEAARDAAATLVAETAALEEALAHLARGETVPTREVIAAERARRDAAWRLIRRAIESGAPPPEDRAGLPEGPLPDAFEALRDAADRLADARADDAQRVNDYAAKSARLALLRARQAEAASAVAATGQAAAIAEDAWIALWAPAGITPQGGEAMAAWRRQRDEILRLAELATEARQRRDGIAGRRAEARTALLALAPDAAATPTLAALLAQAEERCAAAEAAEAAHRSLAERVEQERARAVEARGRHDDATAELGAFEAEWRPAAAALGLAPGATAEDLEAALAAWTRIAEAARAWRGDAARVAAMQDAADSFAAATCALLTRLGAEDPAEPAAPAVARLARRLAEARNAQRDAQALSKQIQDRRNAAEAAQRSQAAAEREIAALREAAGAADLVALEEAIRRAERRDALRGEIAGLEGELLRQGAGLDEAALRTEADGVDHDLAEARLAEIEAGQTERDRALTKLGADRQAVETRLAALQAGRDAAAHAQEARHHLAEAQSAAERYARLHLARTLLQAAIERIRQDQQGPLLRAAGAHLALLTAGRYLRVVTDQDEASRTVLRAVREDRTECPVEALSEGTRDQLYLALRVAAVEAHAAGAEPLPFIADDLLATFDDTRAAAAIALLAELGQRVQAILFTHHAHIADLARRQPGVHVQELPAA